LLFLCFIPALLFAQRSGYNPGDIIGDTFEETSGKGLEIRTNPTGVKVYIDGMERGLTPLTIETLLPGEHSVRLYKDDYKERQFNITLFNNSRLVVSIEMKQESGNVLVTVKKVPDSPEQFPSMLEIISGAQSLSVLSPDYSALLNLPIGYRDIKARAFGWQDASVTVLVNGEKTATAEIIMRPAELKLANAGVSRRRFNPKISGSLGSVVIRFETSAPANAVFSVIDKDGNVVYSEKLEPFTTWEQTLTWNGKDSAGNILQEGVYTLSIEAAPLTSSRNAAEKAAVSLETEINYSINIFPLSLFGGLSGLTFSPLPHVLPKGSFQIEGGVFAGNFQGEEKLSLVPFEAGFRVSPINKLEILSVFNINPRFSKKTEKTGWGISASAKYNILNGNDFPLALAAGFSYTWANEYGESPLGAGKGIGVYAPLSLELNNFSIALSPGVFWRVPPSDSAVPKLLPSAGLLYHNGALSTGVSARAEIDLSQDAAKPKIFAGAELRYIPMSTNFVFSGLFGMWKQAEQTGAYGGLGIGVIY